MDVFTTEASDSEQRRDCRAALPKSKKRKPAEVQRGRIDEEFWEVEKALKRVWSGRQECFLYYIKWKGWDKKHNEWRPEKDVTDDVKKDFAKRWKRKQARKNKRKSLPEDDFIVPDDVVIKRSGSGGSSCSVTDSDDDDQPGPSKGRKKKFTKRKASSKSRSASPDPADQRPGPSRKRPPGARTPDGMTSRAPVGASTGDLIKKMATAKASTLKEPATKKPAKTATAKPKEAPQAKPKPKTPAEEAQAAKPEQEADDEVLEPEQAVEIRQKVRKALDSELIRRATEAGLDPSRMPKLAERIERKLFERCPDLRKRYKEWCLAFFDVLTDDNNTLFHALLEGEITAKDVAKMSESEMNSDRFRAANQSESTTPTTSSRSTSQSPQHATDAEPEIVELCEDTPASPTTPMSPEAVPVAREVEEPVPVEKTVGSAAAAQKRREPKAPARPAQSSSPRPTGPPPAVNLSPRLTQKVPPMVKGFTIPRKISAEENGKPRASELSTARPHGTSSSQLQQQEFIQGDRDRAVKEKRRAPSPLPRRQAKPTATQMIRAAASSNAGMWKKPAPPSAPHATSEPSPAPPSLTPLSNIEVPPSKEAALFVLARKMFNFEVDHSVRAGALIDYLLMLRFNSPDPRMKAALRRQLEQIQVMGALESVVSGYHPDQEMVIRSYNQLCANAREVVKRFPPLCQKVWKEASIKKPMSPLAVLSPKFYGRLDSYLRDLVSVEGFPMTSSLNDALVWQLLTPFGFDYDAVTPNIRKVVADHVARRLN